MYVLDTDTFSNFIVRNRNYPALRAKIRQQTPNTLYISVVLIEEAIQMYLPLIQKRHNTPKIVEAYSAFHDFLTEIQTLPILPFDDEAYQEFMRLPDAMRRRHPRDSRVAAIALSRGFIVVTRNIRHFTDIPGLQCEDWTIEENTES